jgi:anti-sigma regulatory factor (Ser/Thr protein kinase)
MAQVKVVVSNRVVEGLPLNASTTLGRSKSVDVVLPDTSVSREHARITQEGPRWYIEDLGSSYGTEVNGDRVTRVQLNEGDIIQLGDVDLIFTLETTPPEADVRITAATPADLAPSAEAQAARDVEFRIPSTREMVDALCDLMQLLLTGGTLSDQERLRFHMGAQEAIGNAYRHGNAKDASKIITARLIRDENRVTIRVRDEGDGFDFREMLTLARTGDPVTVARDRYQQGRPGGLGIMMMVRGCDLVEFGHGGAQLSLTKCPADLFQRETVYGGLQFSDEPPPDELAGAPRLDETGPISGPPGGRPNDPTPPPPSS